MVENLLPQQRTAELHIALKVQGESKQDQV